MMRCSAPGCKHQTSGKNKVKTSFFRFPKNKERRRQWAELVGREGFIPSDSSYICMSHFEKKMINYTYAAGPRLRDEAFPTIFEPKQSDTSKGDKKHTMRKKGVLKERNKSEIPASNLETVDPRLREGTHPTVLENMRNNMQSTLTREREELKVGNDVSIEQNKYELDFITTESESIQVPATQLATIEVITIEPELMEVPATELEIVENIEVVTLGLEFFDVSAIESECAEVSTEIPESSEIPTIESEHQNSNELEMPNLDLVDLIAKPQKQTKSDGTPTLIAIPQKQITSKRAPQKQTKSGETIQSDEIKVIERLRKQISSKNKVLRNLRGKMKRKDKRIKMLEDKFADSVFGLLNL